MAVLVKANLPNGTNVCFDFFFGPHLPLAFQFAFVPGARYTLFACAAAGGHGIRYK